MLFIKLQNRYLLFLYTHLMIFLVIILFMYLKIYTQFILVITPKSFVIFFHIMNITRKNLNVKLILR